MQRMLESAIANPWGALRVVVDGPLHPGGVDATEALLDRAGVGNGMRVLDVGCGAGESVRLARERGATAVGVDADPGSDDAVCAEMAALPVRDDSVDVVLAECVLCLADDRTVALEEIGRVLRPGGRLAVSDVVVDGPLPDLPTAITRALCLEDSLSRDETVEWVEEAGFRVGAVRDHREDLLAMRDEVANTVDYDRLLGALGQRGRRLRDGVREMEAAVEDGRVGYVSLVATNGR